MEQRILTHMRFLSARRWLGAVFGHAWALVARTKEALDICDVEASTPLNLYKIAHYEFDGGQVG
jgi:hypothetical protein